MKDQKLKEFCEIIQQFQLEKVEQEKNNSFILQPNAALYSNNISYESLELLKSFCSSNKQYLRKIIANSEVNKNITSLPTVLQEFIVKPAQNQNHDDKENNGNEDNIPMEIDGEENESPEQFLASFIYLLLIQIPGTNLFHPFVFRSMLTLLRSWSSKGLKLEHAILLLEEILNVVSSETVPVGLNEDSIMSMTSSLIELTRLKTKKEKKGKKANSKQKNVEKIIKDENKLSSLCFEILFTTLDPNFGETKPIASELIRHLLPNILMTSSSKVIGSTVTTNFKETRSNTLKFIKRIIDSRKLKNTNSFLILLQQICLRLPDKAEYKTKACESIIEILQWLNLDEFIQFSKFLVKYSKNPKSSYRSFSCDLSSQLLIENIKFVEQHKEEEEKCKDMVSNLLTVLLDRCSDKIVTVRSKALSNVNTILKNSKDTSIQYLVTDIFGVKTQPQIQDNHISFNNENNGNDSFSNELSELQPLVVPSLDIKDLLRRRSRDTKANVRKASIQCLESLAGYGSQEMTLSNEDILILRQCCLDSSVLVRKQALSSISNFLREFPTNELIIETYIKSILPMVADGESTVNSNALDSIYELIFERIEKEKNIVTSEMWHIVDYFDTESSKFLQRACALLSKQNKFKKKTVKSIQNLIQNPATQNHQVGLWILFSEMSPYCTSFIDVDMVVSFWNEIKTEGIESKISLSITILTVLSNIATQITNGIESNCKNLTEEIFEKIISFKHPAPIQQALIQTLFKFHDSIVSVALKKNKKAKPPTTNILTWITELLTTCDDKIASLVLGDINQNAEISLSFSKPDEIALHLFTLGTISQFFPTAKVPQRLVTVVQALISPTVANPNDPNEVFVNSDSVRSFAFLALGKLCLEDFQLAKKCIPAFARELETCDSAVIRNNVMIIMTDLCIKYTSVVDNYIPNLALCLKDPNLLVRRQTLMLLSRLLQEGYIKWKGSLFFRFAVSLIDDSPQIQSYATFCLTSLLGGNVASTFYSHFIELIFNLNDVTNHPVYNQFPQSQKERQNFSLKGPENSFKRMKLYKYMLNQMNDIQKFQLTGKLCQDILGGVVDGVLSFQNHKDILIDTLSILSSKDIKLSSMNLKNSNNNQIDEFEENSEENAAMEAAKGKLLTQIVKKNTIENIVPIIIELKHEMEKHRSPLIRNLMAYLKELLQDYKTEIDDIMVADKQLAEELNYDIRQFDKRLNGLHSPAASPRKIFSPRTSSPKPEVSNFAVPRLRSANNSPANSPFKKPPFNSPNSFLVSPILPK